MTNATSKGMTKEEFREKFKKDQLERELERVRVVEGYHKDKAIAYNEAKIRWSKVRAGISTMRGVYR